jgi:CRP-like cAMP-binding protein
MRNSAEIELLRKVAYLEPLDDATISVDTRGGERKILGKISEGGAFGEMSSLTGELRSATVTANEDVDVLIIADRDFDALRERRPEVAVALLRVLSTRLAEAEASIDALFANAKAEDAAAGANSEVSRAKSKRGSFSRVWRELVVGKKRDCAFLTLAAFVITLLLVRVAPHVSSRVSARDRLRVRRHARVDRQRARHHAGLRHFLQRHPHTRPRRRFRRRTPLSPHRIPARDRHRFRPSRSSRLLASVLFAGRVHRPNTNSSHFFEARCISIRSIGVVTFVRACENSPASWKPNRISRFHP